MKSVLQALDNSQKVKLTTLNMYNMSENWIKISQNHQKSRFWGKFCRITKFSFAGSACKNYFSSSKIKFSKTLKTLEQIWYLGHYHSPKTQKIRGGSEGGWKLTFWTICCYVQYQKFIFFKINLGEIFLINCL